MSSGNVNMIGALSAGEIVFLIISLVLIIGICITIVLVGDVKSRGHAYAKGILAEDILNIKTGYLNEREKKFYDAAFDAAKLMSCFIFPKVEVANIIGIKDEKSRHANVFYSCVDFCLFDRTNLSPILIIDLYDNRLGGDALPEIDMFLHRFLQSSGIPLETVETQDSYDPKQLKERFEVAIRKGTMDKMNKKKF